MNSIAEIPERNQGPWRKKMPLLRARRMLLHGKTEARFTAAMQDRFSARAAAALVASGNYTVSASPDGELIVRRLAPAGPQPIHDILAPFAREVELLRRARFGNRGA